MIKAGEQLSTPAVFHSVKLLNSLIKQNRLKVFLTGKRFNLLRLGAVDRNCAFSSAPRSAIINCRLCRLFFREKYLHWQSVLLSQNGSHPQFLSRIRLHTKQKNTHKGCFFVWCGRQELNTC